VHQSKLKRISLGVFLAFLPLAVNAAGLGKLNVMSGLGEPLSAEIEVLSVSPAEMEGLTATIASEEAYTLQGIERPPLHGAIRVEVKKKADGSPVIKLSSSLPITDPFLDMLVQVDWATGRLLREFTLLLDPPGYASQGANNTVASPVVSAPATGARKSVATTSANMGEGATEKPLRKKTKKSISQPAPNAQDAAVPNSITTARGDTLSTIARQTQVEGVSLDQMLVGIYRANKNAFIGENINRLKVGQLIRIPATDELQSVSKGEATEEIRVHAADWKAYRNKLAGVVAEAVPASDDVSSNQSAGGKITTKAEDKAAPPVTGPRDVVKLSKSDTSAGNVSVADAKSMQDKIVALKEEAVARENSIKEANERATALEKQIQDMQKLLAMKSELMSEMQKNASATPAPVETPSAETAKPEVTTPPVADTPPAPPPTPEVAQPAPSVATTKPEPKPITAPVPAPAPVEPPGMLDDLTGDPLVLGGGGIIALLLGGWLYMRNKRRRGLDGFEKSILTSGGLKANTVFGNTLGGSVDTGDTSFLTDFSQSSGGMIDTNDVDPIAEAEVYMAYGRDRQAEEILRDAISKEPQRYELHMKLLEVYAARNDASAFEAMAGEMYTSLGTSDPVWAKVAEIGRKLEPDNPLYAASDVPETEAFAITNSGLSAADFSSVDTVDQPSLDFSVDADAPLEVDDIGSDTEAVATEEEVESALDFDLGLGEGELSQDGRQEEISKQDELSQTVSFETAGTAENDTELDFQLDMDISEQPAAVETSTTDDIDLDLDTSLNGTTVQFDLDDKHSANTVDFEIPDFDKTMPSLEVTELEATEQVQDGPELSSNVAETEVEEFNATFESAVPEISFDLPDSSPAENVSELEQPDFDKTVIIKSKTTAEDIVFDAVPEESNELDLSFDIDLGALDEPVANSPDTAISAPEVDLSGISFDLDEKPTEPETLEGSPELDLDIAEAGTSTAEASEAESSEVDTKLDLVTAYIDMGDNEGAKELLDEVMKEGGPQQRLRANDILKSIA